MYRLLAGVVCSRARRALALAIVLGSVGLAPAPADAGQIGIGDFGPDAQTTTFDGLGLPFENDAPLVIDDDTFDSDDSVLRYVRFPSCFANECLANNTSLGFIDILLAEPSQRAGAYVSGIIGGWAIRADFFDAADTLLGSVLLANGPAFTPVFLGWEDPGGIARIRFDHLFAPNFVFIVDDLTTGMIPEPATGMLVGLGLVGLGALRRRRSG